MQQLRPQEREVLEFRQPRHESKSNCRNDGFASGYRENARQEGPHPAA
jgi:hypothetical protein